jgi:hypothetical protein
VQNASGDALELALMVAPPGGEMLNLDRERETYESALPDMLKAGDGQFVVIHGKEICKLLPTYEQALAWGYDKFGLDSFLVKRVAAIEPVIYMSSLSAQCAD